MIIDYSSIIIKTGDQLSNNIPTSVIGAVSSVTAQNYRSHSRLEALFMESGAPGEVPDGNLEKKSRVWLQSCNEDESVDSLKVLGSIIQNYMDLEPTPSIFDVGNKSSEQSGQDRINKALAANQLVYRRNGYIPLAGSNPISRTLDDYLSSGDFSSIEDEFDRAQNNINTDPHSSITAACSIIEATLKYYIENFGLDMPRKLSVMPLWENVFPHLKLNTGGALAQDQHKILKGISSVIDGIGAFRSHIGSAHGRGSNPPKIVVAEARLVVNAAHTVVVFLMELNSD